MGKRLIPIILLLISLFLRFWNLGEILEGISLSEAKFSLTLSPILGDWVLNPFFLRLPGAILSIASIFLFFYVLLRFKKSHEFAFIGSLLLAFTPWHIVESRIFSPGIFVLLVSPVLIVILLRISAENMRKTGIILAIVSVLIFLFSIFNIKDEYRDSVNTQRTLAAGAGFQLPVALFSNKFIESYRFRQKLLFENLDFGNYFFKGHPRQRWGVEEVQKLFISFLPFLILGLLKIDRKVLWLLTGWSLLILSLLVFFGKRDSGFSLPLLFPIIFIVTEGVIFLKKQKFRWIWFFILILFALEALSFLTSYFKGFEEGQFSPRRTIYKTLVPETLSLSQEKSEVLISERLKDPEVFFKFYSKDSDLSKLRFEAFDYRVIGENNVLYVDILPDDPSPAEPLYKKDGQWSPTIEVLDTLYDDGLRQTVVIFRIKSN